MLPRGLAFARLPVLAGHVALLASWEFAGSSGAALPVQGSVIVRIPYPVGSASMADAIRGLVDKRDTVLGAGLLPGSWPRTAW